MPPKRRTRQSPKVAAEELIPEAGTQDENVEEEGVVLDTSANDENDATKGSDSALPIVITGDEQAKEESEVTEDSNITKEESKLDVECGADEAKKEIGVVKQEGDAAVPILEFEEEISEVDEMMEVEVRAAEAASSGDNPSLPKDDHSANSVNITEQVKQEIKATSPQIKTASLASSEAEPMNMQEDPILEVDAAMNAFDELLMGEQASAEAEEKMEVEESTPKKIKGSQNKFQDILKHNYNPSHERMIKIFDREGKGLPTKRVISFCGMLRKRKMPVNLVEFLEMLDNAEKSFKLKKNAKVVAKNFLEEKGIWLKIDNLTYSVKKVDLEKLLSESGKVKDVYEFGDRYIMASVMVNMETEEDRDKVIQTLNKKELPGFTENNLPMKVYPYNLADILSYPEVYAELVHKIKNIEPRLEGLIEMRGSFSRNVYMEIIKCPSIASGEASLRTLVTEAMKMPSLVRLTEAGLHHPDWNNDTEFVAELTKKNAAHAIIWNLVEKLRGSIPSFGRAFLPVLMEKMEMGEDVSEAALLKFVFVNYPEVYVAQQLAAGYDIPDISKTWVLVQHLPPTLTEGELTEALKPYGEFKKVMFVQKNTPKMTAVFKATNMRQCISMVCHLRENPLPGGTEPSKIIRYTGKFAMKDHPFNQDDPQQPRKKKKVPTATLR